MPNIALHLLLADRVLDRWSESGADAPFTVDDTAAVSAFLHGAIAPDIGYYPRSDRLFSELAHVVRSGDLARNLVQGARTAVERAYAWGWVTHLLGDLAIHPPINRAAAAMLPGGGAPYEQSGRMVAAHMRVEYGLDVAFFRRYPRVGALGLRLALAAPGPEHLTGAFRETYGLAPEPRTLRRAHGSIAHACRVGFTFNRVFSAGFRERPLHALARTALSALAPPRRLFPAAYNRSSLLGAVLNPVLPPDWMVAEVDAVVQGFGERFAEHYRSGLEKLQNYNLMIGALEGSEPTYPVTRRALQALAARGGRSLEPGVA